MKPLEIFIIIFSILLILTIGFLIIEKFKKEYKIFEKYCNETYGENNWTIIYSNCTDSCLDPPQRCVAKTPV